MYQRIQVPVDGSEASNRALEEAIALARSTQGRLQLLHVIDELSLSFALSPDQALAHDWRLGLRDAGFVILEMGAERARAAQIAVETLLIDKFDRRLWAVVAEEADAWLADLIVIGSHGRRGFARLILGSDAEQIVRHSTVPVLLVPYRQPKPNSGSSEQRADASLATASAK